MEFQDVPDDMLLEIFSLLSVLDLLQCLRVCTRWKELLRNSWPWRDKQYTSENPGDLNDIVELVSIIPQMKKLFIGTSSSFFVRLVNSSVHISSTVDEETLLRLIAGNNIVNVTIPKRLFTTRFSEVFQNGRKLNMLIVSPDAYNFNTSDRALHILVKQGSLTEMKVLHLFNAGTIKDDTLLELCQKSPNLEELSLHSFNKLSHKGLENLKMCPKLRVLKLTRSASITNLAFLRHCPNLEYLDLSLCYQVDHTSFCYLLYLKKLKQFCYRYSSVEGLPLMSMAEELKHLVLIDLLNSFDIDQLQLHLFKTSVPDVIVLGGIRMNEHQLFNEFVSQFNL